MIRVPEERGEGTRIVLRSPDPSCNPYLTLAAVLAAGLDGINRKASMPDPLDEVCQENGALRELARKKGLPRNLESALLALTADPVIREALGERIYGRFIQFKEDEWERYQSTVHRWEVEEYLTNY
jgi:glutamine synthetase